MPIRRSFWRRSRSRGRGGIRGWGLGKEEDSWHGQNTGHKGAKRPATTARKRQAYGTRSVPATLSAAALMFVCNAGVWRWISRASPSPHDAQLAVGNEPLFFP